MAFAIRKAERKQAKARVMLAGPSGSGKTYSSLLIAKQLGQKVVIIDTENGSADLYADLCAYDVLTLEPPYAPERYVEAIQAAAEYGADVIIVDSITHEWTGKGGCLELHTQAGGKFQDWAKISPRHQKFIDAMLRCPAHVIATVRTKTAYEIEEGQNGKKTVEKKGTAPMQREGLDYEMTVVFDVNQQHMAEATKDRTRLFDGRPSVIDANTGKTLREWLESGAPVPVDYKQKCRELVATITDDKKASLIAACKSDGADFEAIYKEYGCA